MQTAYLKLHYPVQFMAALMNSFSGNSDKVGYYIQTCRKRGIRVLPPDVNKSQKSSPWKTAPSALASRG